MAKRVLQHAPAIPGEGTALLELAARVRAWRARRGMTRRALAADSGLSLRFLAEVEAGRGNPSFMSLEAIARALNISLLELIENVPTPCKGRVLQLLEGRAEDELEQAHDALATLFRSTEVPGRERRIALLGLRGAGKSTLGSQLAQRRGVPFVELDKSIEREAGTSISEILLLNGQAAYRRYELRALVRVAEEHGEGVVMTTGGSIVSERETFDTLQRHFYCVWLKASPEEHMSRVIAQGDMRPFEAAGEKGRAAAPATAGALEDIRRILASREVLYARADAVVDTAARTLKQSLKDLERAVAGG